MPSGAKHDTAEDMTEDGKREEIDGPDSADEATQLKKRARRRLIGAAALALLAAIVLPMVMDHQPAPPMRDIQVRIPGPDENFPLRVAAKPTEVAVSREEPPKPIAQSKVVPEVEKSEQKVEPKPEVKADLKSGSKPESKSETKPESKAEQKAETKPEEKSSANKPEAKPETKAEPKLEAKIEPKSELKAEQKSEAKAKSVEGSKGGEAWEVQLGAYGEPGRVKILLGKLKELNVPTYTEKVETPNGPRTRVRAGPFPTQEAAEKARNRVKIVGVDGPVVKQP